MIYIAQDRLIREVGVPYKTIPPKAHSNIPADIIITPISGIPPTAIGTHVKSGAVFVNFFDEALLAKRDGELLDPLMALQRWGAAGSQCWGVGNFDEGPPKGGAIIWLMAGGVLIPEHLVFGFVEEADSMVAKTSVLPKAQVLTSFPGIDFHKALKLLEENFGVEEFDLPLFAALSLLSNTKSGVYLKQKYSLDENAISLFLQQQDGYRLSIEKDQ